MKAHKQLWRTMLLAFTLMIVAPSICMLQEPIKVEAAAKMKLNKTKANLNENKTLTLQVKNPTGKVTWSTSNKKVVKIKKTSGTKKAKATLAGVKNGKATITAKVGKKKLKATITVKHVHKWRGYATCTEPDKCTTCGTTKGLALGHNFSPATCKKAATCQRCGATTGTVGAHSWDANEVCTVCDTLNMPRLLDMSITNVTNTTDLVRVQVTNMGRQRWALPYKSANVPYPATLTTNGRTYNVYLWSPNGWLYSTDSSALNDTIFFAIESSNVADRFTITFNATLTFDLTYFNTRTSQNDRYRVTVTPSGSTFTKY